MHMSYHDFDGFDDLCTPCGGGKEKTRKGCGSRMFCGRREGKKNEREVLWPVVVSSPSPGGVDCNEVFLSLVLLILLCYYPSSFISGETLSCARRVSGMNGFEY